MTKRSGFRNLLASKPGGRSIVISIIDWTILIILIIQATRAYHAAHSNRLEYCVAPGGRVYTTDFFYGRTPEGEIWYLPTNQSEIPYRPPPDTPKEDR